MRYISYLIISLFLYSCQQQPTHNTDIKKIIEQWQGKEILFPTSLTSKILYKDTNCIELLKKKYKIVMHADPYGCSECKLQLSNWMRFINETKKYQDKLAFILIVDSPNKQQTAIISEQHKFFYPLFYDKYGEMNRINQFLPNEELRCFLIDSNNQILAIGNPIKNPKIKQLYLAIIDSANIQAKSMNLTNVYVKTKQVNMGSFPKNNIQKAVLTLNNNGNTPLLINDIVTSCGCATPRFEKKPIKPGDAFEFSVEMKPDEAGYFEKTVSVYCNTPDSPIQFKLKGTAVEDTK